MKLLLCRECGDVIAMRMEIRYCACGASAGRYLEDRATVVQTAGSISLALHNHDLSAALGGFDETPAVWHPLMVLRAYVNPLCETDVRYVPRVGEEPTVPQDIAVGESADGDDGQSVDEDSDDNTVDGEAGGTPPRDGEGGELG